MINRKRFILGSAAAVGSYAFGGLAFSAMVATSASADGIVDKVAMWGYVLDKTPTTCPFMFGRTDFSLERAAEEFSARKAMYMNSCFNPAYVASHFDYWGAECVANCISNRLTDLQLDKLRGMDEVWCAATHGQKFESSIAIAKMSLKYPNIVGINFDDFNPNNAELGMDVVSFRALKAAVRSINPKLKFSVVSYAKDSNGTNFDLSPFRGEIDHVSRWKWVTDADYWKRLREEIAELRREVGPGVEIVHGLYLHDFAKNMKCRDPLPLDYFKLSVLAALDAVADGTLDGVILPQVAWYSAPTHQEHYKWLRKTLEERRLAR